MVGAKNLSAFLTIADGERGYNLGTSGLDQNGNSLNTLNIKLNGIFACFACHSPGSF
jgi:hypothetical protein